MQKKRISTAYIVLVAVLVLGINAALSFLMIREAGKVVTSLMKTQMLGLSNTAAGMLDGDVLERLGPEDHDTPEYQSVMKTLSYFQQNLGLMYIYCIRDMGDGTFTFGLDPTVEDPGEFGSPIVYTQALYEASQGVSSVDNEPYTDDWGTFYSAYSPVFDSEGKVAGIVAVDFDADWYRNQLRSLVLTTVSVSVTSLVLGVLLMVVISIRSRRKFKIVHGQLNVLAANIEELTQTLERGPVLSRETGEKETIRNLAVGRENVDALGEQILSMQKKLSKEISAVHEKAYIDGMTSVRNKAAYQETVKRLDADIQEGKACFSAAVFDMNGLKEINDSLGHGQGDQALIDASRVLAETFGKERVYRVGGDEFIVIVREDMDAYFLEVDKRTAALNKEGTSYRFPLSFAKGSSAYIPGKDREFQDVFRRADMAMYEDKAAYYTTHVSGSRKYMAFDRLTGLQGIGTFLAQEKWLPGNMENRAIVFLDLYGMKVYNHKFGFTEGDRLLRAFGGLLTSYFGMENSCRSGADHFAAVAEYEGLEDALKSLFLECEGLNKGNSLPVRAGIYCFQEGEGISGRSYDKAKLACDSVGDIVESGFLYYSDEIGEKEERKKYIIANINLAVKEGWITICYQPAIRSLNGRVCSEEALARWDDPVYGLMMPSDFIPYLEEINMAYILDLYVTGQILDKIHAMEEAGLSPVPQSINVSRSDFGTCDIVKEIQKRVDAAGVSRDMLAIEITESVLASNFDFMKEQIEQFRSLGFQVWLDDFGSGYSSLDMLQKIQFDAVKFDMGIIHGMEKGNRGKALLADLVRLVAALGVGMICEGVETMEQACFLQNIGCTRLQGYYYMEPLPLEEILSRYREGGRIELEDRKERPYYEAVGRVNLYDAASIADKDDERIQDYFSSLPMAVLEILEKDAVSIRGNQQYRDFLARYHSEEEGIKTISAAAAEHCLIGTDLAAFEIEIPDGRKASAIGRKVGENPVSGTTAIAVGILSIR